MLSRLNPAEPVDVWRVMSPTSYQAAPPRENIIADAKDAVKSVNRAAAERLPLAVARNFKH
jgi:hypothetical protein